MEEINAMQEGLVGPGLPCRTGNTGLLPARIKGQG